MSDEELKVSTLDIHDIGQRLIDLGELLVSIGRHSENDQLRKNIEEAQYIAVPEVEEDVERQLRAAVRRTLAGLNGFRRDYYEWERLVVEYALRRGFTQREVASLLGVGLSTVNRWAQNPLTYPED